MRNDYLNKVILRGSELSVLEQASLSMPRKASPVRWILAASFGLFVTLCPSICLAQSFFTMM